MRRIKKGDQVLIVAGDTKGKIGKVLSVLPERNRIVVEGDKLIKRHTRPSPKVAKGGIIEKERTIHLSNVMLYCPKCSKPTRPTYRVLADTEKGRSNTVRLCRHCGEII